MGPLDFPVIPLTTYTIKPTGGVIPLTVITIIRITPNHTRSSPAAIHRGRKIGIVIIIRIAASKTIPPTKKNSNTLNTIIIGGRPLISDAINIGIFDRERNGAKLQAPAISRKTIPVVLMEFITALLNPSHLIFLVASPITRAAKAPSAPASTTVIIPV
jgi:hypothetical protein